MTGNTPTVTERQRVDEYGTFLAGKLHVAPTLGRRIDPGDLHPGATA